VPEPLWQPSREHIERTTVFDFTRAVERDWDVSLADTTDLWRFSVDNIDKFWRSVVDYFGLAGETWEGPTVFDAEKLPGAKWFPEARFNFAENLLKRRDDADAMVFWCEDQSRRRVSFTELHDQVSRIVQALRAEGIGPGDRIGAYLPNMPEAVAAMLAAGSLGAVWSSCSPDFGVQGVLDRFGQIEPKILFTADGYRYNGKTHDSLSKIRDITAQLPSVERVVVIPFANTNPDLDGLSGGVLWDDFIAAYGPGEIAFHQLPFDHPLYIMYSSGTTGAPKCIVHSTGGTLLKHACEHGLHCDIKRDDRVFFFTTCGWMMWNWLASVLARGATVMLYDGSPFYPSPAILFDYAETEETTFFGTSAKFIDALAKSEFRPIESHDLAKVTRLWSTGSPLVPEGFDFVYQGIKKDVQLASFTGGTDIMGGFAGGDPTRPVWRGELQARMLGMDVDVFDSEGQSLREEKGELVCKKPFPSVPLGFLNDPDGERFHNAYFDVFPNIWCHGDYVEITEHDGLVVYGRSDATLNPGGVRIGTAEIYRQVEKLDAIQESIVIGQEWDNDVRVVLFVVLRDGLMLDDDLIKEVRDQVRRNCTPRHVPAKVVQVTDIPRTKSGKITELAVRDIVHGRPIKNKEALANPDALALFADRDELKT